MSKQRSYLFLFLFILINTDALAQKIFAEDLDSKDLEILKADGWDLVFANDLTISNFKVIEDGLLLIINYANREEIVFVNRNNLIERRRDLPTFSSISSGIPFFFQSGPNKISYGPLQNRYYSKTEGQTNIKKSKRSFRLNTKGVFAQHSFFESDSDDKSLSSFIHFDPLKSQQSSIVLTHTNDTLLASAFHTNRLNINGIFNFVQFVHSDSGFFILENIKGKLRLFSDQKYHNLIDLSEIGVEKNPSAIAYSVKLLFHAKMNEVYLYYPTFFNDDDKVLYKVIEKNGQRNVKKISSLSTHNTIRLSIHGGYLYDIFHVGKSSRYGVYKKKL